MPSLYGPRQSRFARYLERQEERRPDPVAREHRRSLLDGLRGHVIEVGCGDGRAFELYPTSVEAVLAVEPDPVARAVAEERAADAAVPIEVAGGVAEALPADDGAFDAAVAVWVLCSVSDPGAALGELRRVLKPGGELRFYEQRPLRERRVRSAPARGRRALLDPCARRLQDDPRHGNRDPRRRLPRRRARAWLPLVVAAHDHLRAARARGRALALT
jgi:SAM-dependent methyltransferase